MAKRRLAGVAQHDLPDILLIVLAGLAVLLGAVAGCTPQMDPASTPAVPAPLGPRPPALLAETGADGAARSSPPEDASAPPPQREPDKPPPSVRSCYLLRPGGHPKDGRPTARCEPQSLPYARCRSGIMSCRFSSETGPLTWFACERRRGNTTDEPAAGRVLILEANHRHRMPTGHVIYVEDAAPRGPGWYGLRISHTNYDRACSLETNVEAIFRGDAMTLDILTGAWRQWARGLRVAGFILGP